MSDQLGVNNMPDEKKLIIDEDWKSQVQAEKEAAAKTPPEGSVASAANTAASPASEAGKPSPDAQNIADIPMPAASLELLVTTLASEALVALGQIPHPATGQAHIHRGQAQYLIDTIDVLREKTKGNLTTDEEQMLESILHQLRMIFIQTASIDLPASAAPAS
jgi:hypothetical protein